MTTPTLKPWRNNVEPRDVEEDYSTMCIHCIRGRCELTEDVGIRPELCNYHSDDWEWSCERYVKEHGLPFGAEQ